jgi:uncharacterized protein DUF1173
MSISPHLDIGGDVGERQVFDIGGVHVSSAATRQAQQILADAHTHRVRPLCLCVDNGVPMYVARVGDRFIVKRMPDTGMVHATDCPSYLPPEALSGLGQVLGGAILEQAETGITRCGSGSAWPRPTATAPHCPPAAAKAATRSPPTAPG